MRSSDWSSDVCSSDLEAGTRLMKQLGQLARIMAWIDGKVRVDEETMHQVKRVAMDTAYGFHLEIVDAMMRMGGVGTRAEVCTELKLPMSTLVRKFEALEIKIGRAHV